MSYNPFSLNGKHILITGASSGIGKSIAIECSKMGCSLMITGRNEDRLLETFSELEGTGHKYLTANLDSEDDLLRLADACSALDGVVFNAGLGCSKPINFIKAEDLDDVYRTNLFSIVLLNRILLKKKLLKKGASLVFTSSLSAHLTGAGLAVYASSKAAVCGYMRTCALELAAKGIRANAILPGMVETKLINAGTYSADDRQGDMALYPLGRYGSPEDIAHPTIFLLSDASSWMTGTEMIIDGGRSLK